ncbi:virulence factor Mce family protein [Pseudonocardia dioxanivorans CB1190]|uniref:Virulence factor Mce family protein n=1 Tax=Pseudonocardia dioxanivorans (strain ATCC 55486 / DSM 44775 / JCM 13855 / CB1190) TaxID=675635 RepID=F4CXJ7_PSEUX|nr:MCE family protein [Pseudonocardia dioxanivorans]AEA27580.1 virulence factor Mce family protein [Pseudonocardia dioxanivorans CB1190]
MRSTRRVLQGVAFIAVIALMVGLAVAKYAGAFDSGVPVTLDVDHVGAQLNTRADVKVRGMVVGRVEDITTNGARAVVTMEIDPDKIDAIPADVSARLLPKTLFGEKYVSLVPPATPAGGHLRAGDVIPEDRSRAAVELERVLDGLLPLLRDVEPQQLATTLGALSQALSGRGEELGHTLVQLDTLLEGLNPSLPDLNADITQLADYADNLDGAAPDLLNALDDLRTTSTTIVDESANLRAFEASVTGASDDLTGFLRANGDNIVALSASSRPTLESLARYAPEFPCFFQQMAGLVPFADNAFGKGTDKPGIHITLEIVNNKGKYSPGEEPRYLDDRGPRCYPITYPGAQSPPDGPFRDGSKPSPPPAGNPVGNPSAFGVDTYGTYDGSSTWGGVRGGSPATNEPASWRTGMGLANSPGDRQMISELVAVQQGTSPAQVPNWSSMLVGPLYRGSEVTLT